MYRQGDVLIIPTTDKPTGLSPVAPKAGRFILAEGEATGHHHSVDAAVCEMAAIDNRLFLTVGETTPVTHQEHAAIEINPGTYWVVRQREYDAGKERRVRD